MAFLLPKLTTPSCKSPPHPLKSQLGLPNHGGSKLHGSGSAPSHLNLLLLLLLGASQQEAAAVPTAKSTENKSRSNNSDRSSGGDPQRSGFYLLLGTAVRTLRDDLPAVFVRQPNYAIYREDIAFVDPLNTFHGITTRQSSGLSDSMGAYYSAKLGSTYHAFGNKQRTR